MDLAEEVDLAVGETYLLAVVRPDTPSEGQVVGAVGPDDQRVVREPAPPPLDEFLDPGKLPGAFLVPDDRITESVGGHPTIVGDVGQCVVVEWLQWSEFAAHTPE